jgi:hypothetical protein
VAGEHLPIERHLLRRPLVLGQLVDQGDDLVEIVDRRRPEGHGADGSFSP